MTQLKVHKVYIYLVISTIQYVLHKNVFVTLCTLSRVCQELRPLLEQEGRQGDGGGLQAPGQLGQGSQGRQGGSGRWVVALLIDIDIFPGVLRSVKISTK